MELHPAAPMRLRGGQWEIDCPNRGVQPWRALKSAEMLYWAQTPHQTIPRLVRLLTVRGA